MSHCNDLDLNNCKKYVLDVTKAYVIKVYDGDTITIAFKLNSDTNNITYKKNVRLNGIDTPEIRSKNSEEKVCAKLARDYLCNLILYKEINLKNCLYDKYGRLLADLYLDDLHINKDMIDKKYAVQYYGKKKEKINWKEYMAINSC
jgi:micrococcal nuclease